MSIERFTGQVRELFPGCPPNREMIIAEHACLKYSKQGAKNLPQRDDPFARFE
jgi:hypothetical protein